MSPPGILRVEVQARIDEAVAASTAELLTILGARPGEFGSKVIKQHRRKCLAQLREWAAEGRCMELLDDRKDKSEPLLPTGQSRGEGGR